jgi:hypothetical protein
MSQKYPFMDQTFHYTCRMSPRFYYCINLLINRIIPDSSASPAPSMLHALSRERKKFTQDSWVHIRDNCNCCIVIDLKITCRHTCLVVDNTVHYPVCTVLVEA